MDGNNIEELQTAPGPLKQNPLTQKRLLDPWFIPLGIFIASTWMIAVLFVQINSASSLGSVFDRAHNRESFIYIPNIAHAQWLFIESIQNVLAALIKFFRLSGKIVGTGLTLSLTSIAGSIVLGHYKSHQCCRIGVLSLPIVLSYPILSIYNVIKIDNELHQDQRGRLTPWFSLLDLIVPRIFEILGTISALICVSKVGIKHVSDVIKNSTRVYFRFPQLIFFSLVIYGLIAFVTMQSLGALQSLAPWNFWESENRGPLKSLHRWLTYVIFFECCYLIFFLHYYGVAVISKVTATCDWTEDESENKNMLVIDSVFSVASFQFGSIAFGATVIGPMIASVIALRANKRNDNPPRTLFYRVFDILLTLYLLLDVTKYSLAMNSAYGENFIQSTKKTFYLLRKNSSMSYSFIWVFYGVMMGVFGVVVIMTTMILIFWVDPLELLGLVRTRLEAVIPFTWVVLYSFSILMMPIFLIIDSIGQTNYLCSLKDADDDTEDQSIEMSTITIREIVEQT